MTFLRHFLEPLSPGLYIFQPPVTLQILVFKKSCNNIFRSGSKDLSNGIWLFNLSMLNFWWFGTKSRDFKGQNRGAPPLGFRWNFSMLLLR